MAYQTGTVNSLADIQTVIRTFLVDNGWTWDAGSSTIYKDDMFVGFVAPSGDKVLFQAKTALSGGSSAPRQVGLGRTLPAGGTYVPSLISFPANYYAFLSNDEFYFVVNYSVTRYQHVLWGRSTVAGLGVGATGMYISGSINNISAVVVSGPQSLIEISPTSGSSTNWYGAACPAPFWPTFTTGITLNDDFCHTNLDGLTWGLGVSGSTSILGAGAFGNLMSVLPSGWNSESPLLPIRAYKRRPESKVSLVLDLQHARYCRVDNFADQEIITIGTDQWQVFPFHRRNVSARNGGTFIDHTGTFGWAIRKVD